MHLWWCTTIGKDATPGNEAVRWKSLEKVPHDVDVWVFGCINYKRHERQIIVSADVAHGRSHVRQHPAPQGVNFGFAIKQQGHALLPPISDAFTFAYHKLNGIEKILRKTEVVFLGWMW